MFGPLCVLVCACVWVGCFCVHLHARLSSRWPGRLQLWFWNPTLLRGSGLLVLEGGVVIHRPLKLFWNCAEAFFFPLVKMERGQ